MMMKSLFLSGVLSCAALACFSQTDSTAGTGTIKTIGYYGRVTTGILTGDYSSRSFQMTNGFRIGQTDVGFGIGYETYNHIRYAPLFLESRRHFLKGRNTQPFVGITAGYLASLSQNYYYTENRNGFTAGASVGLTHYFTKHLGITSSIGYRYLYAQDNNYYYHMSILPMPMNLREMHRLEVRIGVAFR
jgi:opacity protein-like surface antigen